ncbi:MAG: hypothetical protein EA001_13420 [Oscillatoriales cyanobacterium]|nr:MAG: hypothetical protein EA001_13420 [Oscillatoriales cyanobacterium]
MWRNARNPFQPKPEASSQWQPIDRVAWLVIGGLAIAILGIFVLGDRSAARVREFSWDGQTIGANDRAFVLMFNRPMDRKSVETSLKLDPPLEGKISWAGTRMAFTLERPVPYGTSFRLSLGPEAHDTRKQNKPIEPFSSEFRSRDRAFAYIGTEGAEAGRLIVYELTQQRKMLLTPPSLVVNDFKLFPDRDRILFSATETSTLQTKDTPSIAEQQLYTVTTGLILNATTDPPKAAQLTKILDNRDYQNLKFDLAPDGSAIVAQRADRKNASNVSLWLIRNGQAPQPLKTAAGGEFIFTPDSQSIAITQGQGVAILPFPTDKQANSRYSDNRYQPEIQPLDFLPKFGTVLSFASDGSIAALVKFNSDFTRSLFVVDPSGERELARIQGSILRAEFSPDSKALYALLTQRVEEKTYREQPYIGAFDLQTKTLSPLLLLPEQLDIALDLSPDGSALLFDQINTRTDNRKSSDGSRQPEASDGNKIDRSELWLLPVAHNPDNTFAKLVPQELPLAGARPRWLP